MPPPLRGSSLYLEQILERLGKGVNVKACVPRWTLREYDLRLVLCVQEWCVG